MPRLQTSIDRARSIKNTYSDGTSIIAPFYVITCTSCKHETWGAIRRDTCSKCGADVIYTLASETKVNPLN